MIFRLEELRLLIIILMNAHIHDTPFYKFLFNSKFWMMYKYIYIYMAYSFQFKLKKEKNLSLFGHMNEQVVSIGIAYASRSGQNNNI